MDEDAEVDNNATFSVDLLVEHIAHGLRNPASPRYAAPAFFSISPNFVSAKDNARDNAAGAVMRMIVRNAAAMSLADVFLLIIDALPVNNDHFENRPMFQPLFLQFRMRPRVLIEDKEAQVDDAVLVSLTLPLTLIPPAVCRLIISFLRARDSREPPGSAHPSSCTFDVLWSHPAHSRVSFRSLLFELLVASFLHDIRSLPPDYPRRRASLAIVCASASYL